MRIGRTGELAMRGIVLAGAAAVPLVLVRDATDSFRLPKELLIRGEAILLVAVALAVLVCGGRLPRWRWRDPRLLLPIAASAVFVLLTCLSTRPATSAASLATALATLVVFLATSGISAGSGWAIVAVPLVAATFNAILVLLEETGAWMPFGVQPGIAHHLQCTALIGNPNEIGGYLGAATLACIAALAARGRSQRWPLLAAIALLGAGLIASRTLTAMVALSAAALAMLALSSWRRAARAVVAIAVAAIVVIALVAPLRARARSMVRAIETADYNALLTDRLTPFAAAWSMFADHPLTGVGPGTFAWHYFDYKLRAEAQHPRLLRAYNRGVNYGEVHDDHLQVLAEGGVLGYATFAAVLAALGALSFAIPRDAADPRRRFVRELALPLAVFWAVLSLAQFPLETAVVRSLLVHFAAICAGWRDA